MAIDQKYGHVTLERGTVGEDEPVIVFRGQDRLVGPLLDFYLNLCANEGSPQRHIDAILDSKRAILDWQETNPTQTPQSATYKN